MLNWHLSPSSFVDSLENPLLSRTCGVDRCQDGRDMFVYFSNDVQIFVFVLFEDVTMDHPPKKGDMNYEPRSLKEMHCKACIGFRVEENPSQISASGLTLSNLGNPLFLLRNCWSSMWKKVGSLSANSWTSQYQMNLFQTSMTGIKLRQQWIRLSSFVILHNFFVFSLLWVDVVPWYGWYGSSFKASQPVTRSEAFAKAKDRSGGFSFLHWHGKNHLGDLQKEPRHAEAFGLGVSAAWLTQALLKKTPATSEQKNLQWWCVARGVDVLIDCCRGACPGTDWMKFEWNRFEHVLCDTQVEQQWQ